LHSRAGLEAGGRGLGSRGGGVGGWHGRVAAGDLEAGACKARSIGAVDNYGTVAKEAGGTGGSGGVELQVSIARGHVSERPYSRKCERDRRGEAYVIWKGEDVILPCLPARSPTWHVWGLVASQGGTSPRT